MRPGTGRVFWAWIRPAQYVYHGAILSSYICRELNLFCTVVKKKSLLYGAEMTGCLLRLTAFIITNSINKECGVLKKIYAGGQARRPPVILISAMSEHGCRRARRSTFWPPPSARHPSLHLHGIYLARVQVNWCAETRKWLYKSWGNVIAILAFKDYPRCIVSCHSSKVVMTIMIQVTQCIVSQCC